MSLHLFAGMRVRDFQAARPWYEQLLGEPAFLPHATEAVWTLADDRAVYRDPDGNELGFGGAPLDTGS
jgi:hypothetical protein